MLSLKKSVKALHRLRIGIDSLYKHLDNPPLWASFGVELGPLNFKMVSEPILWLLLDRLQMFSPANFTFQVSSPRREGDVLESHIA